MFRRALVVAAFALVVALPALAGRPVVPARIVSLSPTATETLFAVGAGKQVVAVDDQSSYPASAPRTKLSGIKSSAEAIAAYRPDLVVLSYDPGGLVKGLAALKIPVLVQGAATSLADAYAQIRALGARTGHAAAAGALVSHMRSAIAAAVASAKGAGKGEKVYYELDDTLYSVTSKTFVGQILTLFGLRDVADAAEKASSGYPQLSNEFLVAANPDVVVLADTKCCGQSAKTLAARPGWDTVAAVQRGRVIPLDDDVASRWGPRTVALVQALAAGLRGG